MKVIVYDLIASDSIASHNHLSLDSRHSNPSANLSSSKFLRLLGVVMGVVTEHGQLLSYRYS